MRVANWFEHFAARRRLRFGSVFEKVVERHPRHCVMDHDADPESMRPGFNSVGSAAILTKLPCRRPI